jgi:hypothetical protein
LSVAWEVQFQDEDSNMNITLKDFFGLMGSNNDINLLNNFPMVAMLLKGETNSMSSKVNGNSYPRYYLLAS